MKKIVSMLLILYMCFSLCFALASCNDETSANNNSNGTTNNSTNNGNNTNVPTVNSFEEIEETIGKDIEQTVNQLNTKWQSLKSDITTYDEYTDNADKVEDFYDEINNTVKNACVRLQQYTVQYAELIMKSNMSNDDKYDAFEELLDCIYEDASDDLKDGVYEDLFDDMQDALYEGVLDDSDEAPSYSEWYDVRSEEYSNWYDSRSDVYNDWYDTRSDVYSFCYDIRIELWSNDIERAEKIFNDYKEDVEKLS